MGLGIAKRDLKMLVLSKILVGWGCVLMSWEEFKEHLMQFI